MSTEHEFKCIDHNICTNVGMNNIVEDLEDIWKYRRDLMRLFHILYIENNNFLEYIIEIKNIDYIIFLRNHRFCKRIVLINEYGLEKNLT